MCIRDRFFILILPPLLHILWNIPVLSLTPLSFAVCIPFLKLYSILNSYFMFLTQYNFLCKTNLFVRIFKRFVCSYWFLRHYLSKCLFFSLLSHSWSFLLYYFNNNFIKRVCMFVCARVCVCVRAGVRVNVYECEERIFKDRGWELCRW